MLVRREDRVVVATIGLFGTMSSSQGILQYQLAGLAAETSQTHLETEDRNPWGVLVINSQVDLIQKHRSTLIGMLKTGGIWGGMFVQDGVCLLCSGCCISPTMLIQEY